MKKQLILILAMWLLSFPVVYGQITNGGLPPSFSTDLQTTELPVVRMPKINLAKILVEDEKDKANGLPPRFGYPHDVNLNLENSGIWTILTNGDRLWTLEIECPDALSINLLYDRFWLPKGGKLYIYDKSRRYVLGAITEKNNKGSAADPGKFATGLVNGESITLEYLEPRDAVERGTISISRVIHGYRKVSFLSEEEDRRNQAQYRFGDSQSCQVNVNCSPEGDNWQDEKKGIALILASGTRVCTGSLINNARQDGTPYFLTANHCLADEDAVSDPDLGYWSFYWDYESVGCDNGTDFMPPSTNGAVVVANSSSFTVSGSDFALLLLDENPLDAGIDVYFNGWDRRNQITTSGVGIHHPTGDIKKISTFTNKPESHSFFGKDNKGQFWRPNWAITANGFSTTQQGSSGSPLFNADGLIVGQLYGGGGVDCSDTEEYVGNYSLYGKIYTSWQGEGISPRRLRDWLDPDNTGIQILDGIKIQPEPAEPPLTGTITREYWTGISGTKISDLTTQPDYPENPTGQDELSSLEAVDWNNSEDLDSWANNYGQRIRGYIVAPVSGEYTFWVSGDDQVELYLSTDENPVNVEKIAYVNGWTRSREWDKYTSQKSSSTLLTSGNSYYVEVLHKEGGGGDRVAVGWSKPGESGTSPSEVVPGNVLMGYIIPSATAQVARKANEGLNNLSEVISELKIHPNPTNGTLNIEMEDEGMVYIYNVLGDLVWRQRIGPGNKQIYLSESPGIYLLRTQTGKNKVSEVYRFMIE